MAIIEDGAVAARENLEGKAVGEGEGIVEIAGTVAVEDVEDLGAIANAVGEVVEEEAREEEIEVAGDVAALELELEVGGLSLRLPRLPRLPQSARTPRTEGGDVFFN